MSRRRWSIWLGPPIAIAIVAVGLMRLQAGADAGGKATPVAAGACAESPVARDAAGRVERGPRGAWWRLTERLDSNGLMIGRGLVLGQGGAVRFTLQLSSETLASGPVGGLVALTTDDGTASEVRLVSIDKVCSWTVRRSSDVVRGAFIDPSDGSVVGHALGRETRADLGTWRYSTTGAAPTLILGPIDPDALGERVFGTDYRLDTKTKRLAVQSCSDVACVTRLVDLGDAASRVTVIAGPQGQVIGFAGGKLLTWDRCEGLPCGILAWDIASGTSALVVDRAESAAVTEDGELLVAVKSSIRGRAVRLAVGRDSEVLIMGIALEEQLLAGGVTGFAGFEAAPDEVALAITNGTPRAFRPAAAEVLP
jgi:hypothetical protein